MRLPRTPFAVILCAAVAGCAVGPDYNLPSAPLSATFKEAPGVAAGGAQAGGWTRATPADTVDRGDWWMLFGDPALDALEARVQISNQNIIAAEAAYRQARALVSEQRAALFPAVSLDGSATRSKNNGAGASGSGGASNSYHASIGGGWEVDVWGRLRRAVLGAHAGAQASAADLAAARLAAQGELAVNYIGLRETDAELALDQQTVRGYQRTLTISQNQFDAGVAARSDLLQAQTQLLNAQAQLAGLQQTRAIYEHAVAVLVGEAPGNFTLPPAPWIETVPMVEAGLPSTLLQRRPDIAAAERRVAAANAQIGVQTAGFFPDLSLTGSYGGASSALGSLFNASNLLWSVGASAAQTVFDAGATSARVRGARASYDQAVAIYRQTVLDALQDVENQLVAARVLQQQAGLRRQASDAADAAERIVLNQYQAGQISYVNVVTAQAAAASARQALVQVIAQRQTAAAALIQSLGGGWRADANP